MPNAELERLKLVAQIEILERNVADLEKQIAYLENRLMTIQDQLYDCSKQLDSYKLKSKVDDETAMDRKI